MIIFNESLNGLLKTLEILFSKFENEQSRMYLWTKEISVFRVEISESGINADPNKTDSLRRAKPPQNVNELRSFLGLCTYVSKFTPNYPDRTVTLRKLFLKNQRSVWNSECQDEFENLKEHLTEKVTLKFYDVS